jgi:hypothetical protein
MITAKEMNHLFDLLKKKYEELEMTQNYENQFTGIKISPDNTCTFSQCLHEVSARGSIKLSPKEVANLTAGASSGKLNNDTFYTLKLSNVVIRLNAIVRDHTISKFMKDNP